MPYSSTIDFCVIWSPSPRLQNYLILILSIIYDYQRRCPNFWFKINEKLKDHGSRAGLMSKKRDKSTKDSKDKKDSNDTKHCKSKNANGKKWEPHSGYYKKYEARRRGEGHVTKLRIKTLIALLFEIYSPVTPSEIRMIPYMVCLADREFHYHSYRQHVSYLQAHQGTLHMYGLKTIHQNPVCIMRPL